MCNSLSTVHPELVLEWSEKNLPLTPDKITYGSNKLVWWKGKCGHEWQASVKARSNGEKCPICSGARVVEGINDLATVKPELAAERSRKNKALKPTSSCAESEFNAGRNSIIPSRRNRDAPSLLFLLYTILIRRYGLLMQI